MTTTPRPSWATPTCSAAPTTTRPSLPTSGRPDWTDTYTVQSADVENHESSLVPLDSLAKFALTLLIVVLAVGAVVLNLFNICERKYEVGVLTAIGVKKVKMAAQFAIELLIVTMCGIALGVAGGAVASVPVSNQLRLLAGDPDRQPGGAVRSRRRHGRCSGQQL